MFQIAQVFFCWGTTSFKNELISFLHLFYYTLVPSNKNSNPAASSLGTEIQTSHRVKSIEISYEVSLQTHSAVWFLPTLKNDS